MLSAVALPRKVHTVVTTLHPAFALRGNPAYKSEVRRMIARGLNWSMRESGPDRTRLMADFVYAPSPRVLQEGLNGSTSMAIDVETQPHDNTRITICGIAPSESRVVYAFPWQDKYIDIVGNILSSSKILKIGHNFAFDARAFASDGLSVEAPVVDTIQAASLLWPPVPRKKQDLRGRQVSGVRWLALSTCVLRIREDAFYWKDPNSDVTRRLYSAIYPDIPDTLHPFLYCGLDCAFTRDLWPALKELLIREDMYQFYREVIAPAAVPLYKMERRGIMMDIDLRDRLRQETRQVVDRLTNEVTAQAAEYHRSRVEQYETQIAELTAKIDRLSG